MYALPNPVLLLVVSALTGWQVAVRGPLVEVDAALRTASVRWTSPGGPRAAVAEFCADLGGAAVAGGVLALGAAALAVRRRSAAPLLIALLAALSVPALVLPLKAAFARPGPDGSPLAGHAGYFPSGHAVTAAVAYGTLALLCGRAGGYVAAAVVSLCTGAGLVLRDYHWASDVVAGWALAGLVLCVLARLGDRLRLPPGRSPAAPAARPPRASPAPEPPGR